MRIGLVPLDERPVNAELPSMVAAIAGAQVALPPAALLPRMRTPGDADGIAAWIETGETVAEGLDALVVALDLLGHGGLIASRTTNTPLAVVLARLDVLARVRAARPTLPIAAVATVTRAADSYSAAEEPEYWSRWGRELHRLGAELHRAWLHEPDALAELRAAVPPEVREDFLARRMRNHAALLHGLGLAAAGVLSPLLLTADDTAARSAGSLEQLWLAHWIGALRLERTVLSYPGADEVGAVLVARCLAQTLARPPRVAVRFPEPGGGARIARYENVPVATTVERQLRASGADLVEDVRTADAVLVVHAPDPAGADWGADPPPQPAPDPAPVADVVVELLAAGAVVGLADVRQANGGDPGLVARLHDDGSLGDLAAYGAWNTAGNAIGSVVAALVARVAGEQRGTLDARAEQRLLLHRLLEDCAYQAVIRTALGERDYFGVPFEDDARLARHVAEIERRLAGELATLPGGDAWRLQEVRLPWRRTFEVGISLVPIN